MATPLFFKRPLGLTVGEIAVLTGAEPSARARLDHLITSIAPLDRAGPSDLAFLDTAKYADALMVTHAGACLTTKRFEKQAPTIVNVLCTHEPYRAFVAVARKLYPDALSPSSLFEAKGVEPQALVHPSARIRVWGDYRSGCSDRTASSNRNGNRNWRHGGNWPGRAHRARLLHWAWRIDYPCTHRRQRDYPSRLPNRARWIPVPLRFDWPYQSSATGSRDRSRPCGDRR